MRSTRRYRHDTDVYPRENCIAPDYASPQERGIAGIAHRRDTGEMGGGVGTGVPGWITAAMGVGGSGSVSVLGVARKVASHIF